MVKILNASTKTLLADQALIAKNPAERMKGLLTRKQLSPGEALIITRCQSIHMMFMKFSIDVLFVDRHNTVVGLVKKIKPFQISPIFWKSDYAVELPAGTISEKRISIGDGLQILP